MMRKREFTITVDRGGFIYIFVYSEITFLGRSLYFEFIRVDEIILLGPPN